MRNLFSGRIMACLLPAAAFFATLWAQTPCILPPPPPADAPSDWRATVHADCFQDLERLGLWVGGTAPLKPKQSPQAKFKPVSAGSIQGRVTVVVHGWAPGYREAVDRLAGRALWWTTGVTNSDNLYASDWAWTHTNSTDPVLEVSGTGLFQQVTAHDPGGVVLGYSWIDDSATGGSFLDLVEVYRSEAYTNLNGLRLANALTQALEPDFFKKSGNSLHIIGHSHGAKVATVATLTLQNEKKTVPHLSILDPPETEITLIGNGANLLGYYLPRQASATFIDNYSSIFGVSYALPNVVDVALNPSRIYSSITPTGIGDQHSYSAAWYAGAAVGAKACAQPKVGLDWPPPPEENRPALNQTFPMGLTDCSQWPLKLGPSIRGTYAYSSRPLKFKTQSHSGNVQVDANGITLHASADGHTPLNAIYRGCYVNRFNSNGYGVGFMLEWSKPTAGDYLVVSVDAPEEGNFGEQEVILVLQGQTAYNGPQLVSFNADVSSGLFRDVAFSIFFIPARTNASGQVKISSLEQILVDGVPSRRSRR